MNNFLCLLRATIYSYTNDIFHSHITKYGCNPRKICIKDKDAIRKIYDF